MSMTESWLRDFPSIWDRTNVRASRTCSRVGVSWKFLTVDKGLPCSMARLAWKLALSVVAFSEAFAKASGGMSTVIVFIKENWRVVSYPPIRLFRLLVGAFRSRPCESD